MDKNDVSKGRPTRYNEIRVIVPLDGADGLDMSEAAITERVRAAFPAALAAALRVEVVLNGLLPPHATVSTDEDSDALADALDEIINGRPPLSLDVSPLLPIGTYQVVAERPGFTPTRWSGVVLQIAQTLNVNFP